VGPYVLGLAGRFDVRSLGRERRPQNAGSIGDARCSRHGTGHRTRLGRSGEGVLSDQRREHADQRGHAEYRPDRAAEIALRLHGGKDARLFFTRGIERSLQHLAPSTLRVVVCSSQRSATGAVFAHAVQDVARRAQLKEHLLLRGVGRDHASRRCTWRAHAVKEVARPESRDLAPPLATRPTTPAKSSRANRSLSRCRTRSRRARSERASGART